MEEWNVVSDLSHFFFSLPLIFSLHWWPLAFLILSPLLQNFHVVLPTKKCLQCFFSLSLDLCRPFSRWVSHACRFFSFSLSFSCSIFQIYGHDNKSKLNTLEIPIKKQFLLSSFVFIDPATPSALQDVGGYAISCQNNIQLHLGCHTCWLSYFTLVCLWCRRTVGRTVTWLLNFLG